MATITWPTKADGTELIDDKKSDFVAYTTYIRGTLKLAVKTAIKADPIQWSAFAKQRIAVVLPNATRMAWPPLLDQFFALQALAHELVQTLVTNRDLIIEAIGVNAPSEV